MAFKRAVLISILASVIGLMIRAVISDWLNVSLPSVQYVPQAWYSTLALYFLLAIVFTLVYFHNKLPSMQEGLFFGIVLAATSLLLDDFVFVTLALATGNLQHLLPYYLDWHLYATLVLIIASSAAVGAMDPRGEEML